MKPSLIITCEHAGNEVPPEYANLFEGVDEILMSHRGWDPGALQVAEFLAEGLQCSLYFCPVTRLLVEANRSINNPQLFSEYAVGLSMEERSKLLHEIYFPYRIAVEKEIEVLSKPVVHLSIHSFTPVWNEVPRAVDIGLLFDPSRVFETDFCSRWRNNLAKILPGFSIAMNEPYKGTDDGFTTYLRTVFYDHHYAGIEVEVNQKFVDTKDFVKIQSALLQALPL